MSDNSATGKKAAKRVKPNEPCPCGSGKKYKKCCRVSFDLQLYVRIVVNQGGVCAWMYLLIKII